MPIKWVLCDGKLMLAAAEVVLCVCVCVYDVQVILWAQKWVGECLLKIIFMLYFCLYGYIRLCTYLYEVYKEDFVCFGGSYPSFGYFQLLVINWQHIHTTWATIVVVFFFFSFLMWCVKHTLWEPTKHQRMHKLCMIRCRVWWKIIYSVA